jgi:hypothetical protein
MMPLKKAQEKMLYRLKPQTEKKEKGKGAKVRILNNKIILV